MDNIIATIDIGSSKIKTIIGHFDTEDTDNFNILGVGISKSNAIRKGNILDMEEFKNNLEQSLLEAEKMSGQQMVGAFLSFNSSSLEVVDNKGVVAVSGEEVENSDVERALDMAKSGVELPNRETLKVIPDHYSIDLESNIKSPVGMTGRKLEVKANIFSVGKNIVNNIRKAVSDIGVEIYDIYPNLISSPEGILNKRQKELGVVVIDIGSSTTGITVYEEGTLKYSSIVPVGGDNITSDLSIGLRTSIDVAESLKIEHSDLSILQDEKYKDKNIDLNNYSDTEEELISHKFMNQIIEARVEEILRFVNSELKKIGRDGMLPEGAVLVGGTSKLRGLVNKAKDILRLPVIIGLPHEKDSFSDTSISDPTFASGIGTMILAHKYSIPSGGFSFKLNLSGIFESFWNVLKKILP